MKIIEINIIQFGKLQNATFKLEDGFNIVKGDNESGKSTLLGFIKFALYGVGRKNPNIAVGERERAVSWNAGIAAGSLTLEDECGKRYRIERSGREGARGAFTDSARIIDLETGEPVFVGEVPGEHFLGINAQAYDSMCKIKQLEAVAIGTDAVKGVIDNLLSSGDENMNIQLATKMLDTERRRLLHVNGRGGLVYESENTVDRLKQEHRGAVAFENECAKNRDELERVELALAKARDEHTLAQRMCDLHDDALRLEKFEELRALNKEISELEKDSKVLDSGAGFNTSHASYEQLAGIKSASESLERSRASYANARAELEDMEREAKNRFFENPEGLAELIEEFGSPKSALTHLGAKKKKRTNSALLLTVFGIAGALMLVFAGVLALAMNNIAGAATVAFLGLASCAVAVASHKKYALASAEIKEFVAKLGEGFCPKNEDEILRELEAYCEEMSARARRSGALESARTRLSVAEEAFVSDKARAHSVLSTFGISAEDDEEQKLDGLAEKMKEYLLARSSLDETEREKRAICRSLNSELERFSESDIRARLTPEIIEKIKGVSFEHLKKERDAALHRTNQLGQYRAGIERNLAAITQRRPSNDIYPELEAEQKRLGELKMRLEAVKLAIETINSASANLKSDITPRIRERAQRNISIMTAGKYSELYIDENMGLSIFADGATRPIDSLSKGSLDVAYFAVRLALVQALLADKNPPIFMDESLSQLDDGRARNTLELMSDYAKSAQCVLFTCQTRDVAIAQSVTDLNLIELN